MTTSSENITLASDAAVLTTLRALTAGPPGSIADARDAADRQATHLRDLLPSASDQMAASLTGLVPSIVITSIDTMPVAGTSFWAGGHWHIHIRASDPTATQALTVLHQLKHIIDHPLRHQTTALSNVDWETLADRFAGRVLARTPRPVVMSGERTHTR